MRLKRIPAGTFRMGSPGQETREEHPHEVEITRPFFIGACEVTQEEYEKVMGTNPSHFKGPQTARHPVEKVSWEDAVAFCQKLSDRPDERAHGRVYRLPTEAEWEYAARAGSDSAYAFGADPRLLDDHAWYAGNAGGATHPVGLKKANAWGLFDMHGNVREWCADYYDEGYYPKGPRRDPPGPSESAAPFRVLRGGSWADADDACRSAARRSSLEGFATGRGYGFRVVLLIDEKKP
jgi:formylglycine-generating enzyme required for sulfatase activity